MANFNEKELEIIGQYNMPGIYGAPDCIVPKQNRPITPKENMLRMLNGEMPLWVPNQTYDNNAIQPMVMPDAKARAFGGRLVRHRMGIRTPDQSRHGKAGDTPAL